MKNADGHEMNTDEVIKLLELCSTEVFSLDITGGEPLLRDDIQDIAKGAASCGYKPIFLNTNASRIHLFPELPNYVSYLIVSMTTPERDGFSNRTNCSLAVAEQSIDNITYLAKTFPEKLVINSVIDPDNIDQAYAALEFCIATGGRIAFVPDNKRIEDFEANSEYAGFLEYIQSPKIARLKVIAGSRNYYDRLRELRRYPCYPELVAEVDPMGNLYAFCEESGDAGHNIVRAGTLSKAFALNVDRIRRYDCSCSRQCWKIPSIELYNLVAKPVSTVIDLYQT